MVPFLFPPDAFQARLYTAPRFGGSLHRSRTQNWRRWRIYNFLRCRELLLSSHGALLIHGRLAIGAFFPS